MAAGGTRQPVLDVVPSRRNRAPLSLLATFRTRIPDRNLWVVYATTWVLATAYGLALATTPLVLHERHFSGSQIGTTASWFGAGIVGFAIPSGAVIRRFGARRTLTVCILGYAAMIGLFPFLPELWQIGLCRCVDGAFSVGVWVSCETLILARAHPEHKAFSTSVYAIATGLGYFVGGGLSWALSHATSYPFIFVVAAGVAALSSALAALKLEPEVDAPTGPAHGDPSAPARGWLDLAWRIKTSSAATFCTGFFQASVVIFLPLYLIEVKHIDGRDTSLVTAVSAAGMLVISNVAGRIGDRRGHLAVLRTLALIGLVVMLSFVPLTGFGAMLAAVLVGGGCLASIPPLSLALQGAIADPSEYARSNSIFNVFFATGLLLGPFVTGRLFFDALGPESILYLFAGLWGALVVVGWVFRHDDPAVARRASGRTSPA